MSQPKAPTDVRIVYTDDTVQAVECVYAGEKEGVHRWMVVTPLLDKTPYHLLVEELPAHTEVSLGWPGP